MTSYSKNTTQTESLAFPPIFVCGVQRSGTTLLIRMLSRHPTIRFLPQETHLFPLFWQPKDDLGRFGTNEDLAHLTGKMLPAVNYGWTQAPDFLDSWMKAVQHRTARFSTTASLLRHGMAHWQQIQGGNIRTGEKTPAHIYYAPEILKEFPECSIILMCRDPRAAALSELVKLEGNTRTERTFGAFNFIVRWATAVALAHRLTASKRAILIRYEDLIAQPEITLKKATDHLNIPMIPEMLQVGVTNSSFSDKKQEGIGFNQDNLNRWEQDLPEPVCALIEHHLQEQMLALNYPLTSKTLQHPKTTLLKQRLKLTLARQACLMYPARFHHFNRNQKYRF